LCVYENYIGNFSIWGITSNQGWNLILSEALAGGISFGVSAVAKGIGRMGVRVGTKLLERFPGLAGLAKSLKHVGGSIITRLGYSADDLLSFGYRKAMKELSQISLKKLVLKGVKEYFELVGEVIFEMAFDSVLRFDESERPYGGGEMFITAMTLSILTSGLMRAMGRKGIKAIPTDDGIQYNAHKARLILPTTALALQLAMIVMRIPVITGNMQ
jgi:hypothetical protein